VGAVFGVGCRRSRGQIVGKSECIQRLHDIAGCGWRVVGVGVAVGWQRNDM